MMPAIVARMSRGDSAARPALLVNRSILYWRFQMKKLGNIKTIAGAAALAGLLSTPLAYAAGASAGADSRQSGNTAQTTQSSSGSDTGTAKSSLSQSDQRLMRELAQANLAEISTAKLAMEKSKNEQVRSFAQKMIDDHTQAGNKLEQLAQQKGVTLPTEADAKHQAEMKKLQALSEQQFDKQYMKQAGMQDHKSAHSLLSRIASRARDQDLKQLASSMMPTVDSHLAAARKDASGNMGGSTSSGSDTGQKSAPLDQGGSPGGASNSSQGGGTGK